MPIFAEVNGDLRSIRQVQPGPGLYEREIQQLIWSNFEAFYGFDLFPVALDRAVSTGGRPDIVALDESGRVVIFEVKRWREISLEKLPIYYELDFVIVKDHRTIEAWMEVKERKAFYDPWIFPLSKWLTCKKFSEESGKPVYVVQSYPKGNNIVTIALEVTSDLQPTVIWAGRKDRGDWQDMAPHVELPNNWFTIIEETHLDTN